MADPGFPNGGSQGRGAAGAEVLAPQERRRREDRGAEGAEGGGVRGGVSPSLLGEGAVPPPQKIFGFFI